jgi:hypothetical protein
MQDVQPQARSERQTSLPTLATPEPGPAFEPEPSLALAEQQSNKLTWCVDLGAELRAMSTLDLWIGLSRGEVPHATRVWRLGREAWTPASEVAELACALKPVGDDYPIIAVHSLDGEESERLATLAYGEPPPGELIAQGYDRSPSHVDPSELSNIERAAREIGPRARTATLSPMLGAAQPIQAQPVEETPRGRSTFAPVASISPPAPFVSTPPTAMSIPPASAGATVHHLPLGRRVRRTAVAALAAAAAWLLLASPLSSTTSTATPLRALTAAPSLLTGATRVAEPIVEERRATELALARIRMHLAVDEERATNIASAERDEAELPTKKPAATKPIAPKPRAQSAKRGPRSGKSFSPTHRGQKRAR